jgi:diguanylate cyclase (GGDEF)-like protein
MTRNPLSVTRPPAGLALLPVAPPAGAIRLPLTAPLRGLRAVLLAAGGLVVVALIALLDACTDSRLSFGILYLLPVAFCAWWGGFSPGILLALAGTLAWHLVDRQENPLSSITFEVWNGVVRFGTFTLVASLVSRLHAGILREHRLARTDPLTGAANARTFYETAVAEAERARRAGRPLTLAYFDVDNFKQLNDQLGHVAGDATLRHVVCTIHLALGGSGLLARLGGDEFALLLPGQGAVEAVALLERLQVLLLQEMAQRGWPVTLSVGAITFLRPGWDVDLMIQRVDALMYGAKRNGKGRLEHAVMHEEPRPAPDRRKAERRATARVLCHCPARVRCEGQEDAPEEMATLRDLSVSGVGLHLSTRFPMDTILVIEPLLPVAKALLARVVRVTAAEDGWLHGCSLPTRLTAEELGGWLGAGSAVAGASHQARSLP